MKELTTSTLANQINGKLIGLNRNIRGIFNILKDAKEGDVVIRHWIDNTGIEMAAKKGVSCLVTQSPRENALEVAKELKLPLILTDKIEFANEFAIRWSIKNFAPHAIRVVVTGTNGKSTTSHLIYCILNEAGYKTYTNTDSKSEFNTLIDPMVAKQISESKSIIEALVVEVSEVQGWLGKIMKNHAYIMTSAVDPNVIVMTNVSLDHIGLVNSIEEIFTETSGAIRAFGGDYAILNSDDSLIKRMEDLLQPGTKIFFYGDNADIEFNEEGVSYRGNIFLERRDLPFQSQHFLQNVMAAIGASIALGIDHEIIKNAVSSYKPLKRRFAIIHKEPFIIDDFAHNPAGIRATIKSAASIGRGKLWVVNAIRGSRGENINSANANAIAEGLKDLNYMLIITNSRDVVDDANTVELNEKKVFIDIFEKRRIKYIFHEMLYDALEDALESSKGEDTILLLGAQGMDPGSELLEKILSSKSNSKLSIK
jgi:UDP-N-acetylmuramoyl-L-alanyl-D-glutamate--2,6-diaminopimelate ligase